MSPFANFFLQANADITHPLDKEPLIGYKDMLDYMGAHFEFFSTLTANECNAYRQTLTVTALAYQYNHNWNATAKWASPDTYFSYFNDMFSAYKGYKLFFVNSSNFGHLISAALSRIAFSAHGRPNVPKVLINVDQHTDFGYAGGAMVHNGGWGKDHLRCAWRYACHCAYISLLATQHNGPGVAIAASDKDEGKLSHKKFSLGMSADAVIQEIERARTDKQVDIRNCDVYITVDRDVMSDAKTHFHDPETTDTMVEVEMELQTVLNYLGNYRVVGADVTGLCPSGKLNRGCCANQVCNVHHMEFFHILEFRSFVTQLPSA